MISERYNFGSNNLCLNSDLEINLKISHKAWVHITESFKEKKKRKERQFSKQTLHAYSICIHFPIYPASISFLLRLWEVEESFCGHSPIMERVLEPMTLDFRVLSLHTIHQNSTHASYSLNQRFSTRAV